MCMCTHLLQKLPHVVDNEHFDVYYAGGIEAYAQGKGGYTGAYVLGIGVYALGIGSYTGGIGTYDQRIGIYIGVYAQWIGVYIEAWVGSLLLLLFRA